MKVLVIGCGSIGRRHLANILALDEHTVSVYDTNAEAAEVVASRYGVTAAATLEGALGEGPDCVFVTTPPADHIGPALAAARADCDLFIEKPLSHSLAGVEELIDEVKTRERIAMVGCNLRFHPTLVCVKGVLEEGRLGTIYSVHAEAGSYLPGWRPGTDYRANYAARRELGGGVLLDSIHELDYLRWLVGEIREVRCEASQVSSLEVETEDLALVLLRFESGALGSLHLDYFQRPYSRHGKIIGEHGVVAWDIGERSVRFYDNRAGAWTEIQRPSGDFDVNQIYVDEIRAFFLAVEKRAVPMSELREAARVLELAVQCRESAGLE